MFGIDSSELAIIALVALLVIGPKDLPRLMRVVGQWMAKARGMTRHVRAGFDTMMREAELDEMKKQWAAQNEAIMKASALPDLGIREALPDLSADEWMSPRDSVGADMRALHSAAEAEPNTALAAAGDRPADVTPAVTETPPTAKKPRRRKADANSGADLNAKPDASTGSGTDTAVAAPAKPPRKRAVRAEPQASDG